METGRGTGLITPQRSFWRRHRRLTWVGGGVLLAFLAFLATVTILLRHVEPFLKARIVQSLEDHFHARVELDSFHVSLIHGLSAEGKGLRIWPPAEMHGVTLPQAASGAEPIIRLDEFRFHAPLRLRPHGPIHIPSVQLKGLRVSLPPKSYFEHPPAAPKSNSKFVNFEIGMVKCDDAQLVLGTDKPGKVPLDFEIAHVKATNISPEGQMNFEAQLTNPKPLGLINTTGKFGPWNTHDPGESPVRGDFHFDHADLGTIKGIGGILNSIGHYQGTLRDLTVDGETETPDFHLSRFNSPMNLHTRYHAKVDGTDGDTWLQPVEATLGHSHFFAEGQVVRVRVPVEGDQGRSGAMQTIGHDIALDINVDKAHIDDFLRLTSRSGEPLLTGNVVVHATLHVPPGKDPVPERMALFGRFDLNHVLFTSAKVQNRIEELSERGQGHPKDAKTADPDMIQSRMEGDFRMARGVIALPGLKYNVPGAEIQLAGTYTVEGGGLNFEGTARTQATISQMVGGWKGLMLKPADRFFKKDGAGAEIPIRVRGTREAPDFGIDFGHMKKTSPQRPGDNP